LIAQKRKKEGGKRRRDSSNPRDRKKNRRESNLPTEQWCGGEKERETGRGKLVFKIEVGSGPSLFPERKKRKEKRITTQVGRDYCLMHGEREGGGGREASRPHDWHD